MQYGHRRGECIRGCSDHGLARLHNPHHRSGPLADIHDVRAADNFLGRRCQFARQRGRLAPSLNIQAKAPASAGMDKASSKFAVLVLAVLVIDFILGSR